MKKFIRKGYVPLILSAILLTGCGQKADVDTVNAVEAAEEERSQSESRSTILEEKLENEAVERKKSYKQSQKKWLTFMYYICETMTVYCLDRVFTL